MKTTESVHRLSPRLGFTLGEVMVSVTILAMMTIALFSFVQYVGQAWIRSHSVISLTSESLAVLDFLERELARASTIVSPNPGAAATSTIIYSKMVSDNPTNAAAGTWGTANLRMDLVASSVVASISTAPVGWTVAATDGASKLNWQRCDFTIARHVQSFKVTRIAGGYLQIYVQIQNNPIDEGFKKTVEATRSVLLPSM